MSQSKEGSHTRRTSVGSQKLLFAEFNSEGFEPLQNASRLEVDQALAHGVKKSLKDVRDGLNTSRELLKVLNRICGLQEQNPTSVTLFSAVKSELDRACIRVNKLIEHHRSNVPVIDLLLKEFAEEKRAWKVKERDRIRSSIMSIAGELEREKKLRQQTERLNQKLGRELADTRASLSRAMKELESEKRAREILEQICDELAEGIDEDRGKVEALKQQSEKVREEVEKEKEMLQLADALREERVQMKLSEAKYEFEEKNAIIDKLKSELEFKLGEERNYSYPNFDSIKELERYLKETLPIASQHQGKEKADGVVVDRCEQDEEDDLADSDLCSIELNMDVVHNGSKRKSIDKKHSGKRLTSEKIQRQSFSSERVASDGIEWELFSPRRRENSDILNSSPLYKYSSESWRNDYENEIDRYNMIKDLGDDIVQISPSQGFANDRKQWGQHSLPPEDPNRVVSRGLSVLQGAI